MLKIIRIPAFNDNYIWLLHQQDNHHCVVVDPGDFQSVINILQQHQLTLESILITHHHADHIGGVRNLVSRTGATVYGPLNENIDEVDFSVTELDEIQISDSKLNFTVYDVPGHTKGHIAYLIDDALFCGDTLFAGGCGRLFEGTAEQMFDSLTKISHLEDGTKIYCAHEYTQANLNFALAVEPDNSALQERITQVKKDRANGKATVPSLLAVEKATNPFLRCHLDSVTKSAKLRLGHSPISAVETFATIRQWKDSF